jgi:hypothetical protein
VYGKLYGAINAGVRSQGNKAATQLTKGWIIFLSLKMLYEAFSLS